MGFRTVSVRINDELYRRILEVANERMVSVSDIIRIALLKYLSGDKNEK